MDERYAEIHQAAAQAKSIFLRLGAQGGMLSQIAEGDWDERLAHGTSGEFVELLRVMRERARLDRITLEHFAPE